MNYCKQYKHIPNTLKAHRLAKDLTQKEVANRLHIKNHTLISRWENGKSFPDLINVIKLCSVYEASFQEVFRELITEIDIHNKRGQL